MVIWLERSVCGFHGQFGKSVKSGLEGPETVGTGIHYAGGDPGGQESSAASSGAQCFSICPEERAAIPFFLLSEGVKNKGCKGIRCQALAVDDRQVFIAEALLERDNQFSSYENTD